MTGLRSPGGSCSRRCTDRTGSDRGGAVASVRLSHAGNGRRENGRRRARHGAGDLVRRAGSLGPGRPAEIAHGRPPIRSSRDRASGGGPRFSSPVLRHRKTIRVFYGRPRLLPCRRFGEAGSGSSGTPSRSTLCAQPPLRSSDRATSRRCHERASRREGRAARSREPPGFAPRLAIFGSRSWRTVFSITWYAMSSPF